MKEIEPVLEICANSIESAIQAHKGGAKRVELCSNLDQGGTTPSAGMIAQTSWLPIEVYVLIRPRIGDFLYNETEYQTILSDIKFCKENGCEGVVVGFLNEKGEIDAMRTAKAVALASPMKVTFHRAFDCVENPFEAMEIIIQSGCERILTSGLATKAVEGKKILKELVLKAEKRISIMAGSGVNHQNLKALYDVGIREFHSSASISFQNENEVKTEVAKEFYLPYRETVLDHVQSLVSELQNLENEI